MVSFPLMELASETARRGIPVVLTAGRMVSVGDPVHRALPLLGVRFGAGVDAVGSRVGFGRPGVPPPVVVADRWGEAVLFDPLLDEPFDVDDQRSIVVDTARQALGLATPAPERAVADYLDAAWLDRVLEAALDAPLGEPPRWPQLASLHPAVDHERLAVSPEQLAHRRRRADVGWSALRRSVVTRRVTWPPISASLASWFDDGSFARHLLSQLPEPEVVCAELCEVLRPADASRIGAVVAP